MLERYGHPMMAGQVHETDPVKAQERLVHGPKNPWLRVCLG